MSWFLQEVCTNRSVGPVATSVCAPRWMDLILIAVLLFIMGLHGISFYYDRE